MSREVYIARAAALQVAEALQDGGNFFCEQLPPMDVQSFLVALSEETTDPSAVSLALVGYDLSDEDLRDSLHASGLAVAHFTTDLHYAAKWRNEPEVHSNIIALATGRHPGVSTLAHFPRGNTREFARSLLGWALKPEADLASTPPQQELLRALAEKPKLSPLVSLTGVAQFLATWQQERSHDELDAPRRALPRLGILPDRNLLSASNHIADRLLLNFDLTQKIARMPGSRFENVRLRVKQAEPRKRTRGLKVLERAEKIRSTGDFRAYSALDYEEARKIFKPASPRKKPAKPRPVGTRDSHGITRDGSELLIDGNNKAIEDLVKCIHEALTDAMDADDDDANGYYEYDGNEQEFKFAIERQLLTWVRFFCSVDVWGGFFESRTALLEDAVRDYSQCNPTLFRPLQASISHEGQQYSLRSFIELMQQELSERDGTIVDFARLWDHIIEARSIVLQDIAILIHQPMLALAGDGALCASVAALLTAWDRLYAELATHHAAMHQIDHAWTRVLFEAIASLDVIQIRTKLNPARYSWKAVMLPTHPLHLWRYERIAMLARALQLDGMDRTAVLEQLEKPEHYLGVIYLASLPEGRGASQALPIARDHRGLAVFENLRNAYSGDDGLDALQHCVRQFSQIYVNHSRPLRLALINLPNASRTLVTLLRRPPGRPISRTPLLVDIYATPDHESRLLGARRFSTEDRDQIEANIAEGRLDLRVNDEVLPLAERLQTLRDKPVHIVAVFDEATTAMLHQPGGTNLLPMSPFAIRRRIAFQGIQRKLELLPSHEESVFRSFYDMVGRLQGTDSSQTPQASADAELMAKHIDRALTGSRPAALWFFFADRALPSPGGVHVARIHERQNGRRRTVCYDATYERLALLLRSPLDRFNLRFSVNDLQQLLNEGVAMLGDGLLDLFKADAQPDIARVRGFAGTLIAARDYRKRHPGALLVSVDTRLARLWLRLADTPERCDLLALSHHDGTLTVDAIEVKTTGQETGVSHNDVQKATNQLVSTLEATRSGLDEATDDTPLAAPRQEMLKEVFVSGCQAITATKEDRSLWAEWLKNLFHRPDASTDVRLRGIIYAVELSNNSPTREETLTNDPYEVVLYRLREARIQNLVSFAVPSSTPHIDQTNDRPPETPPSTDSPIPPPKPDPGNAGVETNVLARSGPSTRPYASFVQDTISDLGVRFEVGHSLSASERKPYYLQPSNTKLNQLNIGVVGDLGTGKTQLTKALIYHFTRGAARNRGHAPKFLIFDYKRDYTNSDFVSAVGAQVVTPHRIPLNVFDLPSQRVRLPAARLSRVKFLNDALHKIYGGIGPRQRNHLKQSVVRAYDSKPDSVPTFVDVMSEYAEIVGDRVDAPYSILSDLVDLEVFVERATEAKSFDEFFTGVTVIDLAALGIGEKERNMLVVLFLNIYYEYMINLVKQPYSGRDPQLRFIDSMLLIDEADNIMKYNFDVLRQILLQGREFGAGVLLASQFLSHFKTRQTDYSEPLLTWFIHKVPNITSRDLEAIGLSKVAAQTVDRVKSLEVHHCLYKTLDVPGRFMRAKPLYEILSDSGA